MLSKQEEDRDKLETLENDLSVLQQRGSTFHQHAQEAHASELAQGRFAAVGSPRVVGSTPNPSAQYPAASSAHQTELPPEPALGFSVSDLEPSTELSAVEALPDSAPAAAASVGPLPLLPDAVPRGAGSGPSSSEQTNE